MNIMNSLTFKFKGKKYSATLEGFTILSLIDEKGKKVKNNAELYNTACEEVMNHVFGKTET